MTNTSQDGKDTTVREEKLCRVCAVTLLSNVEYLIGVHVRCVYNAQRKYKRIVIPEPGYGSRE